MLGDLTFVQLCGANTRKELGVQAGQGRQWRRHQEEDQGATGRASSCWELLHPRGWSVRVLPAGPGWSPRRSCERDPSLTICLEVESSRRPPSSLVTLRIYTTRLTSIIHFNFWLKSKACTISLGCLPCLFLENSLSSLSFIIIMY